MIAPLVPLFYGPIQRGLTAVEVGTATFVEPRAPLRIAERLDRFLEQRQITHVSELRAK